ncbi:exosome non-catalytic core subunit rrp46 [Pleosporales sp. CAS-2024a]
MTGAWAQPPPPPSLLAMVVPEVRLTHLNRADGSATYSHHGFSILGAVNGPMEVLRRDEMPEEATIEVHVRPAAGVGSPRERHLETLVHNTLRSIVLTRMLPRTLVQVTLQVRSVPHDDDACGINSTLTVLPHLLHTALLSLLSASIPLSTTLTCVLVALPASATPLLSPTANELHRAKPIQSAHVFAFSGHGRMLLNESDGSFAVEDWEQACDMAQDVCCKEEADGGVRLSGHMDVDGVPNASDNLDNWLRDVVRRKVQWEQRWKHGT